VGPAALGTSSGPRPRSWQQVQRSLSLSAMGKAAGAQERAVGGSQVGAPSQQWAEGQREGEQWQPPCLSPGLPTQRRARALASPLPRSALQGQHTQSPRDEAGTGRDPLGSRAACSAPSLLPTTLSALLLSHALPTPAHPAPRKPSPAPRWQYGRCCKASLTPGGNSRRSTGEGFPKDWLPPLSEVTQQRSADLQSILQPFALAAGAWGGKRL